MSMHTITIKDGGVKYDTTISKKGLAKLGITLMQGLSVTENEVLNQEIDDDFELEIKFDFDGTNLKFIDELNKEYLPLFIYCLLAPFMDEGSEESEEVEDE